ncbi:TPA: late control protein D [Escherichia coli]|nr:late control protein D [Escherichia coli]
MDGAVNRSNGVDDAEWTITTLTHTVSPDNGFTTSLELEVRIDDFEME